MIHLFLDLLRYFVVAQMDIPIRQLVGNTDLALQQVMWAKGNDLDNKDLLPLFLGCEKVRIK